MMIIEGRVGMDDVFICIYESAKGLLVALSLFMNNLLFGHIWF
jgi:hypothetical protein